MTDAMTANPFAALLDGVPRHNLGLHSNVMWMTEADVLAALAAAVPADLAEAGKVLEGVTPGPWAWETESGDWPDHALIGNDGESVVWWDFDIGFRFNSNEDARFIAWCREGVPALLARIAAQEATIKGLEAERRRAVNEAETLRHYRDSHIKAEAALADMTKERDDAVFKRAAWELEAKTLETALAAETALHGPIQPLTDADYTNIIAHLSYELEATGPLPNRNSAFMALVHARNEIAAERAKVAKLVEALKWQAEQPELHTFMKMRALAAITEAGK